MKGIFEGFDVNKELLDVFGKLVETVKKYDCLRVLIDASDLDYEISNFQKYKIGDYISKIFRKELIRIACLRCSDKKDDFTEIVATNRGAVFKLFNDKKEAINWLKD